jgi:hypothetical protein
MGGLERLMIRLPLVPSDLPVPKPLSISQAADSPPFRTEEGVALLPNLCLMAVPTLVALEKPLSSPPARSSSSESFRLSSPPSKCPPESLFPSCRSASTLHAPSLFLSLSSSSSGVGFEGTKENRFVEAGEGFTEADRVRGVAGDTSW